MTALPDAELFTLSDIPRFNALILSCSSNTLCDNLERQALLDYIDRLSQISDDSKEQLKKKCKITAHTTSPVALSKTTNRKAPPAPIRHRHDAKLVPKKRRIDAALHATPICDS